ncbi:type I restriction enzyme, R subunit [Spiroplasma helicoides]|uniref:Type I restriction enzyme endonuclease subunit n=1 Tax=Spiroplasma helicoides TaxID=216938 RepID=A0A1B3SKD0_9MOLU|nr:HsdR family type I site-specific deoxyribonuclease [Spiroplasma helicoides]AOG60381.1 type I restriction enzyme, R subunit [Spiroplasma helicoides]
MDNNFLIKEEKFENEIQNELEQLGWKVINEIDFKRRDNQEAINYNLLQKKLIELNQVSEKIANLAIMEIRKNLDSLLEMNKTAHKHLTEGIQVYDDQENRYLTVKLISDKIDENTYNYVRQFKVSNGANNRIPDITLFINGLPIVIMELKSPLALEGIEEAFNQNESLKIHNKTLWMFNVLNFVSNRLITKYGSTTASLKHFYGWNKWDIDNNSNPIKFLFNKEMIYKIINVYTFYSDENAAIKYLAGPHQIQAVENTIIRLQNTNDNRGGVVWHTQGSGKSVTMVFLSKTIMKTFKQSTILLVTDRNTLDEQLFKRFLNAQNYLRTTAVSINSRKDLIEKLDGKKHFGIYFMTVQKFTEETGVLSERDDIFILVDEAHRTQNNLDGEKKISKELKEFIIKFGYARYMRDAFPNAKITGFTGTPLMKYDKDTRAVFGDYTHVYSMNDAVADGATVPIHYEMRKPKILLNDKYLAEMDKIQNEYINTLDPNDINSQQKIDTLLKSVNISQVLDDEQVIEAKSIDMLNHLKSREGLLNGKAMIVANSRKGAFRYYSSILKNFPEYKDKVILVITESNKDTNPEMIDAIVKKRDVNQVASEFRKPNSKYKVAIVVDMWLTGFDVPDLDVMYLDKILKWHNLMQAIARVNRTFEDPKTKKVKETGLIVDYIGIWKFLADALIQYASGSGESLDINIEDVQKALEKLNELFMIVNDHYIKDLLKFNELNSQERYNFIMKSLNSILELPVEEKNKFVKLARKSKRLFKIAYSSISENESTIAKCIEIVNSLLTSTSIQRDINLALTIEALKKAIEKAIDTRVTDVEILESKLSKDINEVANILATEAESLIKTAPRVALELLKHSIEAQIQQIERIRPFFAKMASEKLKEIIEKIEKIDDIQKVIELLKELAREIMYENNKELDFQDPQLQAFFEVISNDEYLHYNKNSEVLRQIAIDLMDSVKENFTDQFSNNPKVQTKVLIELKKILKTKYGYPPEKLGGLSGILIDRIKNEIKINESYFRKDD